MKFFEALLLILIGAILGFFGRSWLDGRSQTTVDYNIILEKIKTVAKLVTVEGEYSNVYNYQDFKWFDVGPFRKTAVIKMDAKVAVGYDLKRMSIRAVPEEKKFVIDSIPQMEVLYIDPQIEYYDMQEGFFNSFGKDDLNMIDTMSRKLFKDAIEHGGQAAPNKLTEVQRQVFKKEYTNFVEPLIERAKKEGKMKLEIIDFLAESAGWTVEYRQKEFQQKVIPDATDKTKLKN